jgi:isopentenyl-diphosphate delta-isomerase
MVEGPGSTANRKQEHLQTVLGQNVSSAGVSTGFERYRLRHCALPEIDLAAVDTQTRFLGRSLRAPLLISGMTGGIEQGATLNRRLAAAAQALGCAMGVGSQRVALEDSTLARHFSLRSVAPDILLFANLGAVQLNYDVGVDGCRRAVEMIEADALVLHLNSLQEALQAGGNVNWAGLLGRIESVCAALPVPVVAKEVGWGISAKVARQLINAGVAAIDVSGAGGTSWSEVERHRARSEHQRQVCAAFVNWGIPTVESLRMVRAEALDLPIIASGGLRTGVEAATAVALGADLVGIAAPLLRAAAESEEAAHDALAVLIDQLRVSMFACGAADLAQLRDVDVDIVGTTQWP